MDTRRASRLGVKALLSMAVGLVLAVMARAASAQSLPVMDDKSPLPAPPDGNTTGVIWQMLALAVIILVLGGLALLVVRRLLPRMGRPVGKAKSIRLLETTHLGQRKAVHLLQVGTKRILVGDSPTSLTLLSEVTNAFDQELANQSTPPGQLPGGGEAKA
jgi:flagellar biogenesis protein FliO